MSVTRPFPDCRYSYYPHQDSFRVTGWDIPEKFEFDTKEEAVMACYVLHDVFMAGANHAREQIRIALGAI